MCSLIFLLSFHNSVACHRFVFVDNAMVNLSIPHAISKPVYLHDVACSSSDLNLLGCSFSKYSGHINDIEHAVVACQKRKDYSKLSKFDHIRPSIFIHIQNN